MTMSIPYTYDYSVTATTTTGEIITDNGHASIELELEGIDDYWDEGMFFSNAADSTVSHVYTSQIEKEGRQLAEITVTIKNLRYEE